MLLDELSTICEMRHDLASLAGYSVDASIYEVRPLAICFPKTVEQVQAIVAACAKHNTPVIARGAATGIAGGCIGPGVIVDLARHMTRILHVDLDEETVWCEPGVVQDQLNQMLSPYGYRLGPDTSTGNRATIGGMLANNSAGAHSLAYGKMVDHIEALDAVLADGTLHRFERFGNCSYQKKLDEIRKRYREQIEAHYPDIPRRASGYNLDRPSVPEIFAGSEGSLGIATAIQLRIVRRPKHTGICLLHIPDLIEGLSNVEQMLAHTPYALELIDSHIIEMGKLSPSMQGKLSWLQGEPEALFVAEFCGEGEQEVQEKLQSFEQQMGAYAPFSTQDPSVCANIWALRKAGLGLLLSRRSYSRGIAFVEDLSVAPEKLAPVLERFIGVLKEKGRTAGIYGHVGPGCVHMRPYFDMRQKEEKQQMQELMLTLADLMLEFGGALSGEHGDGYLRSWLNEKMFGEELYQGFKELKALFDPRGLMNPGKVIADQGFLDNLRSEGNAHHVQTGYSWEKEGGFHLSVDLCNGNGACRKKEGLMCPSFHASGDEKDTTRARGQMLRQIVNGRVAPEEIYGEDLLGVLDLCIECKGCKKECPSQVDMAKMKSEVLYQANKAKGIPLRSRLFGALPLINAIGSALYPVSNWLSPKWLLSLAGISPKRTLPPFTRQRFTKWIASLPKLQGKPVVLMADTYTEFNSPHIGRAAHKVLQALGYQVIVPPYRCCGRPLLSKGLLDKARQRAEALIATLAPYAERNIPIVGLEPSCLLSLRDEYPALTQVGEVAAMAQTFDEFIAKHDLSPLCKEQTTHLLVHGHCHQKALVGMEPTMQALEQIPGVQAEAIDSGCCGMAGSFGYEKEHYDFSLKIGEGRLFPAIRSHPSYLVVASGVSCRTQIKDGTRREALHLAELVADRLRN